MFVVNDSQYLNVKTDISNQEKKYGRQIPKNSKHFIWIENLDDFLEICQDAINNFIDDCVDDGFDDLDEINLGYLHTLNLPRADFLAKHHPDLFCHLMKFADDLFIFSPFFYHNENVVINKDTFLINPITDVYITNNQIFMEGIGYFIKDRTNEYYMSFDDFVNKQNLMICN